MTNKKTNTDSAEELEAQSLTDMMAAMGVDLVPGDDDQGLSLDELGQAYAALVGDGAEPYERETTSVADSYPGLSAGQSDDSLNAAEMAADARVIPADEDSQCDISPRTIIEAILFVGHPQNEPLSSARIAKLMRGVSVREVESLIDDLNESYAEEGAPYRIQSVGVGFVLHLTPEMDFVRDKFYGRIKEAKMSQAAIEALAIVAYNQPITLDEIDRLRGRPCGGLMSQLLRRDLVKLDRSVERPATDAAKKSKSSPSFRTTDRFLELYGLESLDDLPQVDRSLS